MKEKIKREKEQPPYEGRETYEWWWGGKPTPFQRHDKEYNPDDEI